jgi:hypothetical protein
LSGLDPRLNCKTQRGQLIRIRNLDRLIHSIEAEGLADLACDIGRAIEHLAGVGAGAVVGVVFGLSPIDQP